MATAEKTKKELGLCSKDGCENPRADPDSTFPWCKEHRAEYQRDGRARENWRHKRLRMIEAIRATKMELAAYFRGYQSAALMGNQVAQMIESHPGPAVAPEDVKLPPQP